MMTGLVVLMLAVAIPLGIVVFTVIATESERKTYRHHFKPSSIQTGMRQSVERHIVVPIIRPKTLIVERQIVVPIIRPKTLIRAVILCVGWALLMGPTSEYANKLQATYSNYGLSTGGLSEMFWHTRWYVGRFRGAPSDEELIKFLTEHRAAFDALVANYYEYLIATRSLEKTCQHISTQARTLGIWWIEPGGILLTMAEIDRAITLNTPFVDMGVSFQSVDHGLQPWWSLGRKAVTSFLFVPTIPVGSIIGSDPVQRLISTGQYRFVSDTNHHTLDLPMGGCAIRQVDMNWFIESCVPYTETK